MIGKESSYIHSTVRMPDFLDLNLYQTSGIRFRLKYFLGSMFNVYNCLYIQK